MIARRDLISLAAAGALMAAPASGRAAPRRRGQREGALRFIRRADNGDLKDGDTTFRYIGADMPEVTHIRTDWDLEQDRRFRLPTTDELDWIVEAAAQGNFKVIRTWCFPSHFQPELPAELHYFRLNEDGRTVTLNEAGFRLFDYFLARCRELGLRAQVPFVYLIGPVREWADASGEPHPQMLDLIGKVIARRNSVNGVVYRDDPTIFAWESGNESKPSAKWIASLAGSVKRLDPNHLFVDGRWGATDIYDSYGGPELAANRDIDIVSVHTYETRPKGWSSAEAIERLHRLMRGQGRALGVGEISPNTSVEELRQILDTVIASGVSGACWWSFKGARAKGGYTQWNGREWGGGDDLKWPGFESDIPGVATEKARIDLLWSAAYAIEGRSRPSRLPPPTPAKLLPIRDVGHISWIPGTGEQVADIERSTRRDGGFSPVARGFETFRGSTFDLFCDTTAEFGRSYFYRVRSRNTGGEAPYSNVVGPVRVAARWLVDDFWDLTKVRARSEGCRILSDYELIPYHSDLSVLTSAGGEQSVTYELAGSATSLFLLANGDTRTVTLEASRNGRDFQRLPAARHVRAPLHQEFAGFPRVAYRAAPSPDDNIRFVRIRFGEKDVLSRFEASFV